MKCAHFLGISKAQHSTAQAGSKRSKRALYCQWSWLRPAQVQLPQQLLRQLHLRLGLSWSWSGRGSVPALTMQLIPFAQVGHRRQRAIMSGVSRRQCVATRQRQRGTVACQLLTAVACQHAKM